MSEVRAVRHAIWINADDFGEETGEAAREVILLVGLGDMLFREVGRERKTCRDIPVPSNPLLFARDALYNRC